MYGYVVPDKPNLLLKEYGLYRAHYCGVCRAIRKAYGQLPRITVNYDITFFSLFVHDIAGFEAEFERRRCAMRAFGKTGNVKFNPVLERIAALNILLAYYKALDDAFDEGIKGRAASLPLKRAYKKAKKVLPEADKSFAENYSRLRELEKGRCENADAAADCFAQMLREAGKQALKEKYTEDAGEFLYHLGRWTYFADALDDIDEDYKKKRYNPFLCSFKNYGARRQFIDANKPGICAAFYGSINRMEELLAGFNLTQSRNLLRNIAVYGIRGKTERLLSAEKKLKRERI